MKPNAAQVIERLAHLFITEGIPERIRSDNGSEFTAKAIRKWLADLGVKTLFIEPGSPRENGYAESFNARLRDELLNGQIFTALLETRVLIGSWRRNYNTVRPHSAPGYKPLASETVMSNNGYLIAGLTLKVGTMSGGRANGRQGPHDLAKDSTESVHFYRPRRKSLHDRNRGIIFPRREKAIQTPCGVA